MLIVSATTTVPNNMTATRGGSPRVEGSRSHQLAEHAKRPELIVTPPRGG